MTIRQLLFYREYLSRKQSSYQMDLETDLNNYFRNFMRGYELEKTNPGLLEKLMVGLKIKRISTYGLEYRKKIQQVRCKDLNNDITV